MNDETIVLVARLKVKNGMVDAAKNAALALVPLSRQEAGCINYDVHQAIDDESVFVWHETWANQAALDEHFATTFFKEFFAGMGEMVVEPPVITLTKLIS
ncbi:quinol monooxygenase YgiN [Oxalobacteraceae bacterium GrIS 2.11]